LKVVVDLVIQVGAESQGDEQRGRQQHKQYRRGKCCGEANPDG
jgi:hypothetical protein